MRILIVTALLMTSFSLKAQRIEGEVHDADNNRVEFATIRLMRVSDSTVAGGSISDSLGHFLIEKFKPDNYFIKITYAGHEPYVSQLGELGERVDKDLGVIVLKIDKTLELEGVIAKGSLDVLKAGIDKKIYNTQEDLSVRGGSVEDVLNNIPSIEVDQDGNISLRGDGNVTILIDGRPSALAMGDGQNLLDAIPANSIERIEVITNPSARYDPDGTSGIINIVLKKNRVKGVSGLVSTTAATGNKYEANAAVSYRSNKINTYMNYSLDYYEGYRNYYSTIERVITSDSTTVFDQQRDGTDLKNNNTLVLGFDYYFNDRNSVSVSGTGSLGERKRYGYLENFLDDSEGNFIDRWDRESLDPRYRKNLDVNLNYKRELKDELGEWTINLNNSYGTSDISGYYHQVKEDSLGNSLSVNRLDQRLYNNTYDDIYTAQTDFSYVLKKIRARVETGAKFTYNDEYLNTVSETQDTLSGVYFEDTLANYEFSYLQTVAAGYGIFGQELGKFKYQAGLRVEYATQQPNLISEEEAYFKSYFNLFPSAHLKYKPKDDHEFSLSYSKRINRPRSRQLNPFTSYADPFNLRAGNPFLSPEYIDSYDLGYSYTKKKYIMTLSVFHRRTSDVLNRVRVYYPNNISVSTWGNIDRSQSTGFEGVFIIKPVSWFKTTISLNGNYKVYQDDSPGNDWNNSGLTWGGKVVTSIDFWKKTSSLQLNYNYSAPNVTPQGVYQRFNGLDVSMEKKLMKNKLSLVLKVTDIFNQKKFYFTLSRDEVSQETTYKWLTRRYYLTITYKFGKYSDKLKVPKGTGGGGDE